MATSPTDSCLQWLFNGTLFLESQYFRKKNGILGHVLVYSKVIFGSSAAIVLSLGSY